MSELIEPYLSHLRAGGRSESTVASRAVILRRFARDLPHGLDEAATHELAAILGQYTGWTLYTYYHALADFFAYATSGRDPWLSWNPTEDLIRPKALDCLPDPVTDDELAQALAYSSWAWSTVILLAAKAGLRVSEIAALRRQDITPDVIYVRRAKGGNPQTVPTDAELWQRIKPLPAGPITVALFGVPLTGTHLSHRARRHFDRIGLPTVHLHRFRHWYGSEMLARGTDVRVVQECLRHHKLASTQIYTQVTSAQRRAAIDTLPTLTDVGTSRTLAGWCPPAQGSRAA